MKPNEQSLAKTFLAAMEQEYDGKHLIDPPVVIGALCWALTGMIITTARQTDAVMPAFEVCVESMRKMLLRGLERDFRHGVGIEDEGGGKNWMGMA